MAKKNKSGPSRPRPCGNWVCGVSSGAWHEGLTFGRGKLDDMGYWEIPCGPCARAWEASHPEEIAWPFTEEVRKKFMESMESFKGA